MLFLFSPPSCPLGCIVEVDCCLALNFSLHPSCQILPPTIFFLFLGSPVNQWTPLLHSSLKCCSPGMLLPILPFSHYTISLGHLAYSWGKRQSLTLSQLPNWYLKTIIPTDPLELVYLNIFNQPSQSQYVWKWTHDVKARSPPPLKFFFAINSIMIPFRNLDIMMDSCSLSFLTDYWWVSLISPDSFLTFYPQCLTSSLGFSYLDSDKSHLNNIPDPGLDLHSFIFKFISLFLKSLQQLAITYKLTLKLFSMATLRTLLYLPICHSWPLPLLQTCP